MWTFVTTLLTSLMGVLKQALVPLLAYFQGKKTANAEVKEKELKDAKNAQKDKNTIKSKPSKSLDNIVFTPYEDTDNK